MPRDNALGIHDNIEERINYDLNEHDADKVHNIMSIKNKDELFIFFVKEMLINNIKLSQRLNFSEKCLDDTKCYNDMKLRGKEEEIEQLKKDKSLLSERLNSSSCRNYELSNEVNELKEKLKAKAKRKTKRCQKH